MSPAVSANEAFETEDRYLFLWLMTKGCSLTSYHRVNGKVRFVFPREQATPLLKEFSTSPTLMIDYRRLIHNEQLFNMIVHEDM